MKQRKAEPAEFPLWTMGSLYNLIDAKTDLSPQDYCLRFATVEDWATMRSVIEARRKATPAFLWFRCACGSVQRQRGDSEPMSCPKCGAMMRRLSVADGSKVQADEEARMRGMSEQAVRAALYARNDERQRQGLPPLTMEEFELDRKERAAAIGRRNGQ